MPLKPLNPPCVDGCKGWAIFATNGDSSRDWIERCDDCQYLGADDPRTVWDDEAAEHASAESGRAIGWALPFGVSSAHPFLRGDDDDEEGPWLDHEPDEAEEAELTGRTKEFRRQKGWSE